MRVFVPGLLGVAAGVAAIPDVPARAGELGTPVGRVVTVAMPKHQTVHVPGGRFKMGMDASTADEVKQQCELNFETEMRYVRSTGFDFCDMYKQEAERMVARDVYVDEFDIDRNEVSVDEYRACVAAGACQLDPLIAGDERYIRGEWPMVNATWYEAQDFCRWRGHGRLPTEAEWERAARGDNPKASWPWGEVEQPKDLNHGQARAPAIRELERSLQVVPVQFFGDPDDTDGYPILAPPGSFPWGEGPYGTRDQAGNVAEWTADAWVWKAEEKGYQHLATTNPYREGNAFDARVVRGGSWRQPAFVARSNLRDPFNAVYLPTGRFSHVGFRCVRSRVTLNDTSMPTTALPAKDPGSPAPPPAPPPRRRRIP